MELMTDKEIGVIEEVGEEIEDTVEQTECRTKQITL